MTSGRSKQSPQQEPLYLAGRYNKFSRIVSQSPWYIDGNKKVADSVEDFIKDGIKPFILFTKSRFSASGREDVDVRMLGKGRPFVLEINDFPLDKYGDVSTDVLRKCETKIEELSKGRVKVRHLQVTDRKAVSLFQKEGEEKQKQYVALCCINKPFTHEDMARVNEQFAKSSPLKIQQKTPIRVLHRRPLATRERLIYALELLPYESKDGEMSSGDQESSKEKEQRHHKFKLRVTTEAGAYIKELVHGDLGRTVPSLADLIGGECRTDIISLDVEQVYVDWPPSLSSE
jgi:tRNA pseudouridine synthase 10